MKLRKLGAILAIATLVIAIQLCGCSGASTQSEPEGPDYADDEAMTLISKGLMDRWNYTDSSSWKNDSESMKTAINAELDRDKPLRDRQFENSKMQEDVLAYINNLEETLEVVDTYQYESTEYYQKFDPLYNERTMLLKKFVEEYGLTVSEHYQPTLDDLLRAGNTAQAKSETDASIKQLIEKAKFEKKDEGYGSFTYSAVIENTTKYDFKDITVVLGLYDSDDVKQEEAYANVSSWEKGEKAKFEAFSNVDATRIKPSVEYYNVAE